MKGLAPLFIGLFGVFAFSWLGVTAIPNAQIGHLDPEVNPQDENDLYPLPKSGMAERGRRVYTGNGCMYCHSEWVRADYISADIERKWGERRSAPRDYIFARPVALGKMRIGPDLSNIGKRAPAEETNAPPPAASPAGSPAAAPAPVPAGSTSSLAPAANAPNKSASPAPPTAPQNAAPASAPSSDEALPYSEAWHHKHLYSPRSVNKDSIMPSFKFLYEKRRVSGERSADAIELSGRDAPPDGYEIVPSYDAKCLVAFLMSLDQSHPLTEVKSSAAPAAAAASPSPAVSASPPAQEVKK